MLNSTLCIFSDKCLWPKTSNTTDTLMILLFCTNSTARWQDKYTLTEISQEKTFSSPGNWTPSNQVRVFLQGNYHLPYSLLDLSHLVIESLLFWIPLGTAVYWFPCCLLAVPVPRRDVHDVLHDEEDDVVHQVFPRHLRRRPAPLRRHRHRLQPGSQETREGLGSKYPCILRTGLGLVGSTSSYYIT